MSLDARVTSTFRVFSISATQVFENFDSLVVVDAGSDGFKVQDDNGDSSHWPTGVPLTINGKIGETSKKVTIIAPATGTLNATALIYY